MHLLHNEPDPVRYLDHCSDQLPDLMQHVPLRQSVEQWRDVHGRQSRAVHLLHNEPDPVRYLYHRADQLPDLVQHVPLTTAYFPLAAALAIAAPSAATNRRCMHGYVHLRLRRRVRRRRPRRSV